MSSAARFRVRAMAPLAALILVPTASAQPAAPRKDGPKSFVVEPAPAPRPTFRYRLFPLEPDRTPGDAAPVYLRINWELDSARVKEIDEKHAAWIDKPAGEFPVAEARSPVLSSFLPNEKPGKSFSTIKAVIPPCALSGSVTALTT